jgi:hypothetical protein
MAGITATVWNKCAMRRGIRALMRVLGAVMSLIIGQLWLMKNELSGAKREL